MSASCTVNEAVLVCLQQEQINAAVDSFSSSQMSALQTMCKNNEAAMSDWDIENILNWTAAEAA